LAGSKPVIDEGFKNLMLVYWTKSWRKWCYKAWF